MRYIARNGKLSVKATRPMVPKVWQKVTGGHFLIFVRVIGGRRNPTSDKWGGTTLASRVKAKGGYSYFYKLWSNLRGKPNQPTAIWTIGYKKLLDCYSKDRSDFLTLEEDPVEFGQRKYTIRYLRKGLTKNLPRVEISPAPPTA